MFTDMLRLRLPGAAALGAFTNPTARCRRPLSSFKLFDRLIPEDDPVTKAAKEKESAIVRAKLHRSKFAEMFAAPKEKLFVAGSEVVAPGDSFAACAPVALRGGSSVPLFEQFATAPVTLVTVAFQALGQAQLEPWIDAFVEAYDGPATQQRQQQQQDMQQPSPLAYASRPSDGVTPALFNVVYVEGWLFRLLAPLVSRSISSALPPVLASRTAVVFQSSEKVTDVSVTRGACGLRIRLSGDFTAP